MPGLWRLGQRVVDLGLGNYGGVALLIQHAKRTGLDPTLVMTRYGIDFDRVVLVSGCAMTSALAPWGGFEKPGAFEALRKTQEAGRRAKRTQVCGRCQRIAHKGGAMRFGRSGAGVPFRAPNRCLDRSEARRSGFGSWGVWAYVAREMPS